MVAQNIQVAENSFIRSLAYHLLLDIEEESTRLKKYSSLSLIDKIKECIQAIEDRYFNPEEIHEKIKTILKSDTLFFQKHKEIRMNLESIQKELVEYYIRWIISPKSQNILFWDFFI